VDVLADDGVQRALVVVTHPDDADFWAGATVARWSAAGILVTYLVLTDGDADGFDPAVPRADIPRIRRSAQQAAACILDVAMSGFWASLRALSSRASSAAYPTQATTSPTAQCSITRH
jgi:LmbE family N-acetylglucosaminyl deacetylase